MSYLKIMQEKVVISLQDILDCDVQNPFNKMEPLPTSVLNCLCTYLVKEMGRQGPKKTDIPKTSKVHGP